MATEQRVVVDYAPEEFLEEAYSLLKDILQTKSLRKDTLDKINEWIDKYEYACSLSTPTTEELKELRQNLKAKCKS